MKRSGLFGLLLVAVIGVWSCSDQTGPSHGNQPLGAEDPEGDARAGPLGGEAPNNESSNSESRPVVLVTGATGTQGGAVARELLKRGYTVRGLTRNPDSDRALALKDLGAEMVRGDFDDSQSLGAAMAGAHGVFAMTDFWEHGFEAEVEHGKRLVDAARRAGIQHFVYTSVAGAHQNTGIPHFDSKYVVERYLGSAGLPHTIVRPVSFMDNWQYAREKLMSGEYADPRDASSRHQWIAARDIGFFVGEALDHPEEWLGRAEDIGGEEMTLDEFLAVVSEVLGQPVVHKQISWAEHEQDEGEEIAVMTRWFQDVGYSADVAGLRARYPNLTTAREYLENLGWVTH